MYDIYYKLSILVLKIKRFIYYIRKFIVLYLSYNKITMVKDIEVINVRLPEEIVKWLDSLVDKKVYRSRSEAIREFAREYLEKNQQVLIR